MMVKANKVKRPLRQPGRLRWRNPAVVERKRATRLTTKESDLWEEIMIWLQDPSVTLKQIARAENISEDYLEHLLRVMKPSADESRQMVALYQFDQNKIDPYKYGHC